MYAHCIFCSADLLRNEAIEEFPIGSRLAFDAFKGRLWAVCPRCARWNLAPIETRWEAVESAEKIFRDARVRVHSENIGIARLEDGTRMIRIGEALPLEMAAWRYGDQAVRRQRRMWLGAGGSLVGASALMIGGIPLLAAAGAPAVVAGFGVQMVANYWLLRSQMRPVYRVPADLSPTGREVVLRHAHAAFSRVVPDESEHGFAMEVPLPLPPRREERDGVVRWTPLPPLRVHGDEAERMLERVLVGANPRGFGRRRVRDAVERLSAAGEPRHLFRELAQQEAGVFPAWMSQNTNRSAAPTCAAGCSASSARSAANASPAHRRPVRNACFRARTCWRWRWRCTKRRSGVRWPASSGSSKPPGAKPMRSPRSPTRCPTIRRREL